MKTKMRTCRHEIPVPAAVPQTSVGARRGMSGQTMIEYTIVAGVLVTTVAVMSVFLYAFREYAGRILDLVASEYP